MDSLEPKSGRYVALFFLLIATALFAAGAAWCDAGPERKTIVLGVSPNGWPPYLIPKKTVDTGIAIDVMKSICQQLGVVLRIERYYEKRGHIMVAQGKVDAWPDAKEWVEHPGDFFWTEPIVDSEDYFVFTENRPLHADRPGDLLGKTIGTHLGYVYPQLAPFFADNRMTRSDARSEEKMLRMLKMGRTDVVVMNKLVALWVIRQSVHLHHEEFKFTKKPMGRAGYRFMFSRAYDWQPFIRKFNHNLKTMQQSGRLAEIFSAYWRSE